MELCQPPTGLDGRPSKSLTFEQANDVLTLTEGDPLHCYIVVSLLTGARTEEVRARIACLRAEKEARQSRASTGPKIVNSVENSEFNDPESLQL